MGMDIKCPFCGHSARIRTSEKLSLLVTRAQVYCPTCNQLKAEFVGQLTNIKRAVYVDCPEANHWDKTEKETLQEKGIKPLTNDERLAQIKAGGQSDLQMFLPPQIKPCKPNAGKTPLERQQARRNLTAR